MFAQPKRWAGWLGVLLAACGNASAPSGQSPSNSSAYHSGTAAEHFFPLIDNHVYQYLLEDDRGPAGVLIARVGRDSSRSGTWQLANQSKRFRYDEQGVLLLRRDATPTYVLKQPFVVGSSWPGEHRGTVRITATDLPVTVPAGSYSGCLQTVEQRGGDIPLRVETTFCPHVGIVTLTVANRARNEQARLKSYGPAVDIGTPGVRRIR